MNKLSLIFVFLMMIFSLSKAQTTTVLESNSFSHYIEYFNSLDEEIIVNAIPNSECWNWMQDNVPFFECPDNEIEQTYYYRWWVYRKHIKETPVGFVITEFLPEVGHSKKYNTIACASGLHVDEGKWLRNKKYISDYLNYWFSDEGEPRHYSSWFASSIYDYCLNLGDFGFAIDLLPKLVDNYRKWEVSNLHESGLFWSYDDRDGGEHSISGSGLRPTLNSYMYGDAIAISKIATKIGETQLADEFISKAETLKQLMQNRIWDVDDSFFCTIPLDKKSDKVKIFNHSLIESSRHVRELYGYFPWRFMLPDNGFESAWKQIMDPEGFYAPYGPTTAEQRHTLFMKNRIKRCQWDGSSWPFATSMALGGMRNLLHHYNQDVIKSEDFLKLMRIYTHSQHRILPYGDIVPWIGESLHPYSGIWLSRAIALDMHISKVKTNPSSSVKDKNHAVLRGINYNHSSYCDLVISGLVGLEISDDGIISVDPLLPVKEWDWFCLDGIEYRGKIICVLYDKTGEKYNRLPGLTVFVDGKILGYNKNLQKIEITI